MLQRPAPSEDKKAERDSPASAALKCAYHLLQQRIISNPKDMMGILLYGTDKTDLKDGDNTFQHCYLLADLDVPSAQDVKQLRDLLENEEEAEEVHCLGIVLRKPDIYNKSPQLFFATTLLGHRQ
jgi:ATP-dependent DNA helicase 2 subunit 1